MSTQLSGAFNPIYHTILRKMEKYYYEWGNEPSGYVSTYTVKNGVVVNGPQMAKAKAVANGYIFDSPFP